MNHYGNIRKMLSELKDEVEYTLPFYNATVPSLKVDLNDLIRALLKSLSGVINCVAGKKLEKLMVKECLTMHLNLPLAVESIIRPELSKIHLGIALRIRLEMEHHMKPTLFICLKQLEIK